MDTVVQEIEFTDPVQHATGAPPANVVQSAPSTTYPSPVSGGDPVLMMIERAASDPRVDIDKMDRLLQMKERLDAKAAQIEYDRGMADAQQEMAPIRADLENKQTKSRYASYARLDAAIRPIYSRHGFALSFDTGDAPNPSEVRILCTVSHRGGHREPKHIDMPADGKGPQGAAVMTRTHATGAAASYGQRYLLKLIFNLAVGDVDDDGNGAADDDVERMAAPDALRGRDGKLLSQYASDKAKTYTRSAIESINLAANLEAVKDWRRANFKAPKGSNISPLAWLEFNAPSEFERVKTAYENVTGEQW